MARANVPLIAFNRGIIGKRALARADLDRTALSAEIQTNWLPLSLGAMMLRPGWGLTGTGRNNLPAVHIPFIYSNDDTAIVEITDSTVRVKVNETPITRAAVATAFTNGSFASDLAGWTDADETGAVSSWAAGRASLIGTGFNAARLRQTLTVAPADQNKVHAIRLEIERGPVTLKVGTTAGGQDYINAVELKKGVHSLAFTPTGANVYVEISSRRQAASLVEGIAIEAAGEMELAAPWNEAALPLIRYSPSGDVLYVTCKGYQQRRIERRGKTSWSVVVEQTEDGPFLTENLGTTRLTPSGLTGDVTITASSPIFMPGQVGALFRIKSIGQNVEATLTGEDQYSDPIKVTGVGTQRAFTISAGSGYVGTLTVQRSVSEPGAWVDVTSWGGTGSYNDGLDNQIIYYRIGFKTGNYTSGAVDVSLLYSSGSLTGVARVTGFTSATQVDAAVIKAFGSTNASAIWSEGEWSDYRGWPSANALYDGRMWYAGKSREWGSVSDAYSSFDDEVIGDSGTIARNIGEGPVDSINWLLPLLRLVAGGDGAEHVARSSSFDEPLTPSNFSLKAPSTRGSSPVPAVRMDTQGFYVSKSGRRLYLLEFDSTAFDYASTDLTKLAPDVCRPRIVRLAVQTEPETRIHCVLSDGRVGLLVYDPIENIKCWVNLETKGFVEDVFVLPGGEQEEIVYYYVRRELESGTYRTLERWADEDDCYGAPVAKLADCFIEYEGDEETVITGLGIYEGEEVVCWGWNTVNPFTATLGDDTREVGRDFGRFTVTGGQVTLPVAVTNAVVGLAYRAPYKSAKLAASLGTDTLKEVLRAKQLGIMLCDTHAQGIKYGPSFDRLDDMPLVEKGQIVDPNFVWADYDQPSFPFNGEYNADSRICIEAASPRPATVLALIPSVSTY